MIDRILLILSLLPLLGGCTEIRLPSASAPASSNSAPGSTVVSGLKKMISKGMKVTRLPTGYAALGCSQPALYNFCFTVLSADGDLVREVGDGPKIPLSAGGYTTAAAITALPSGDLVVVGHTTGDLGDLQAGSGDGFLARYTKDGSRVWIKQFGQFAKGSSANQREDFLDVTSDASGNLYVAGRTRSNFITTNSGNFDALWLKLNGNGDLLLAIQKGSPYDDEFNRILINAQGQVVVGGQTCGDLFEQNAGIATDPAWNPALPCPTDKFKDVILASYLADGSIRFQKQLGRITLGVGKGAASDVLFDLATSMSGDLFFTGASESSYSISSNLTEQAIGNGGLTDAFVGRVSSSGVLQWIKTWGNSNPGSGKIDYGKKILVREDTSELLVCAETLGNLLESQGGGAIGASSLAFGKGDVVLIRMTQGGVLMSQTQFGNETLGSQRSSQKDSCGALFRDQSQVVLFGASDGPLFPGTGTGFMARDSIDQFSNLLQ